MSYLRDLVEADEERFTSMQSVAEFFKFQAQELKALIEAPLYGHRDATDKVW